MRKTHLVSILHRLTEPNDTVQEPTARLQVRLLLTLMVILIPLGVSSLVVSILAKPDHSANQIKLLLVVTAVTVLIGFTYILSRSRYYHISFYIALLIGAGAILAAARVDETPQDLHALYYLLILVLASSLFFSLKRAALFSIIILILMLSAPLYIPDITLHSVIVGPFNLVLLSSVAYLLVASYRNKLENHRQSQLTQLLKERAHHADQLAALHETSLDILTHRNINELVQAVISRATKLLGVAGGSVYLVDPDKKTLTLTAVDGPGDDLIGAQLKIGEGLAGRVLMTSQPQIIADYDQWDARADYIPPNMFSSVLQVPVISSGQVVGVLSCQEKAGKRRDFNEQDIQLLQGLARQTAIALQNAALFKEEQAARARAERLQAASQALSSSLELQEVFDNILVELRKVVPYDSASVQQIKDEHYLEIIGGYGFPNLERLLGIRFDLHAQDNPNQYVIETRSPILLADAPSQFSGFNQEPHIKTMIHSWLGVPLIFGNQIIGMLALDKQEVDFYTQEHARLVSAFAAQAAVAIENARLFEETRRNAFELETLAHISASLRTAKNVSEMLPILMQNTIEAVNATFSVLFIVDKDTEELVSQFSFPPDYYGIGLRQPLHAGITGHVAKTGEIYLSDNVDRDPKLSLAPGEDKYFKGVCSSISTPLQTPDELVGVMHVASAQRRHFTEADVRLLTAVSNIAANALNRASILDTLEERVAQRTQELAQANARLKDLDTLKTKFITDISHELRTPVATLNLYMDLLERGKEEKKPKYMEILRQKTNLLVRLTEDILNASRLNLYEGELKLTAVNLNETVAVVIAMHQERAQAANIKLVFSPAPHLPPVRAERNQLIQAINNVITNALNFTTAGSVQVATNRTPNTDRVCLQITDTGIGIPSNELDYIFERFYRGQNIAQLNVPGTGLGLSIAKEIVELHNGSIEVESEEGVGSVFRIQWPLATETQPMEKR